MGQMRKERDGMSKAEWTVVGFLLTLVLAILASLGWAVLATVGCP